MYVLKISLCTYVCMYVSILECVYVCMYVCISPYNYISTPYGVSIVPKYRYTLYFVYVCNISMCCMYVCMYYVLLTRLKWCSGCISANFAEIDSWMRRNICSQSGRLLYTCSFVTYIHTYIHTYMHTYIFKSC